MSPDSEPARPVEGNSEDRVEKGKTRMSDWRRKEYEIGKNCESQCTRRRRLPSWIYRG